MTPTTRDTGAVTVRKVLSPGGCREGGGQRGRQFAGMRKLLQENSEESMCVCLGLDWEHELNIKTILFSKHESHSPKEIENAFYLEAFNTPPMKWSSLIPTPNANINLQVMAIK